MMPQPTFSTTPTVYIVEDNLQVIDALCQLLKSVGYQTVTYTDPELFLADYQGDPGCLLLDVRMRGASGLKIQSQLQYPIPIIFISGHGDIRMVVQAMKAGAHDFFAKPFNNQELLDSIGQAIENHQHQLNQDQKKKRLSQRIQTLTNRERQVFREVVVGKISKVIAQELKISPHTVELHRTKIMRKMQVSTVGELIHLAMRYDLLSEFAAESALLL